MRKTNIRNWAAVVAWMALIFILSGQSQLPTPKLSWLNLVLEKSSHALEFGILVALVVRALAPAGRDRRRVVGVALAVAWLYALVDEYHQSFVPGRSSDWSDILFDWLGAILGARLWLYWWDKRKIRIILEDE